MQQLSISSYRNYFVTAIIILVCCYLFLWSSMWGDSGNLRSLDSTINGKKRALIVSVSEFHYEIMIFFAWQLRTLGYEVTVWTLPPTPFKAYFDVSVLKKIVHKTQYVYRWTPLTFFNPPVPNTIYDALVFITAEREFDYFNERQTLSSVISHSKHQFLVNHHSDDLPTYIAGKGQQLVYNCRPPRCTVVHLAHHIGQAALNFARSNNSEVSLLNSYPVFNVTEVFPNIHYQNDLTIPDKEGSENVVKLVIQGSVQSKRRHYDDLIRTLQQHLHQSWELTILGVGANKFQVPPELQQRVKRCDKLSFEDYYAAIVRADLVLSFLSENMHYESIRATSTVPTAILSGSPVLLTRKMLPLYRCLGDPSTSPLHSAIARDDDAASLTAYFALSSENKRRLKLEAYSCLQSWERDNGNALREKLSLGV